MRAVGLRLCVILALSSGVRAAGPTAGSQSVPRGTRSSYGTDFGNRYQYFGLGYGYTPGDFVPGGGGWAAFRGGRGGYGGYGGRGGYGGSRYGNYDQQAENLHEQQMMWSMSFAPMPRTTPSVTVNPYWNPYQSRLGDDIYRRQESQPVPEVYENPFAHHHDQPATE